MRVDESCNSCSRLTANSDQLSCTLINFELVQILVRANERFGSFDRTWELHESRRELQKQAISKSLPIRRRRRKKKENIITYHRQVTVRVMTQTVSLTSVKKRRKRSGEATSKNKEIEKRRKTLVNSHATLTARLTEQWELRKHSCKFSPANSHRLSSSFDPGLKDRGKSNDDYFLYKLSFLQVCHNFLFIFFTDNIILYLVFCIRIVIMLLYRNTQKWQH